MSTLLVASAGGHLQELFELLPRLRGLDDDVTWVTFDTAQARTLLAGEDVIYAHYARPRDGWMTLRNAAIAASVLNGRRFSVVVSTGSTVAVSFLPVARLLGASCHYIESATRISGPSLTGRIVRSVPGIHLYTQHQAWLRPPWVYRGSVFDGFIAGEDRRGRDPSRVVVSLGSIEGYGFRSLIERLVEILPPATEVLWQTGSTDIRGLPIEARASVPGDELAQAMTDADVVIAHAGVGSSLVALQAGQWPILVPRRHARGEHVDDHQVQIATELSELGLAMSREADQLKFGDLVVAASRSVARTEAAPAFELVNDRRRRSPSG